MPDPGMDTLKAARDLGLPEPDLARVAATVSTALEREYEAERHREVQPSIGERRRRRHYVIAALVALIVGGAATIGYAALTGSSTESDGIGCYAGDESGGSVTVVGLDGRRATETCADLWAEGAVGSGADRPPAPLHACVSPDGGGPIRVFASTDASVCDRAGLVEDPRAGSDAEARRFGGFESELMAILERKEHDGSACVGPDQMRQLVERLLAEHELRDWTIEESGEFDRARRCATLALDSDSRVLTLLPG